MANPDLWGLDVSDRAAHIKARKAGTSRRLGSGRADQWGTVEQAYRDGRKDERIERMIAERGVAYCEWPEGCDGEFRGIRSAHRGLDYAHLTRRSRAQGYRPGKGGQNDARFLLLCRAHHKALDGSEPRFGKGNR